MRWAFLFCSIAITSTSAAPRTIVVVDVDDDYGALAGGHDVPHHEEALSLFHVKPIESPNTLGQMDCGVREELLAVEMELLKKGGLDLGTNLTEKYLKLSQETRDYTLTDETKTLNVGGMTTAQDLTQLKQKYTDLADALDLDGKRGCRDYYFPRDFTTDAFLNYIAPLPEDVANFDL